MGLGLKQYIHLGHEAIQIEYPREGFHVILCFGKGRPITGEFLHSGFRLKQLHGKTISGMLSLLCQLCHLGPCAVDALWALACFGTSVTPGSGHARQRMSVGHAEHIHKGSNIPEVSLFLCIPNP